MGENLPYPERNSSFWVWFSPTLQVLLFIFLGSFGWIAFVIGSVRGSYQAIIGGTLVIVVCVVLDSWLDKIYWNHIFAMARYHRSQGNFEPWYHAKALAKSRGYGHLFKEK